MTSYCRTFEKEYGKHIEIAICNHRSKLKIIIDHILQAGDLVLLSETESGLQKLITGLEQFCARWKRFHLHVPL